MANLNQKPEVTPIKRRFRKIRNIFLLIILLASAGFVAVRFYYPYGEGVKSGHLNFVVYKGMIFKTYEGKLIQTGLRSNQPGGIQSNEFEFSISNKELAEKLMRAGGQIVELHYTEYFGALPWRGFSRYIVDDIIRVSDTNNALPEISEGVQL